MDFLIQPFALVMKYAVEWFDNYALALCFYALITKIVLFPLMMKQQKNQLNMVRLRPYMNDLQKKYGNNKEKYNMELQKLYQREGYNPMSSCGPMVIQLPLIILIYQIVRRPLSYVAEMNGEQIYNLALQAQDKLGKVSETLTKAMDKVAETIADKAPNYSALNAVEDKIFSAATQAGLPTGVPGGKLFGLIDLSGTPSEDFWSWMLLIPIVAGLTGFLLSWLSQKHSAATQDPQMQGGCSGKTMLYTMPLITVFFCFSVNCALGLYWTIGNILGIGQQFILHKMYDPAKVLAEEEAKIQRAKDQEKAKRSAAAAKKAAAIEASKKKKKGN